MVDAAQPVRSVGAAISPPEAEPPDRDQPERAEMCD